MYFLLLFISIMYFLMSFFSTIMYYIVLLILNIYSLKKNVYDIISWNPTISILQD